MIDKTIHERIAQRKLTILKGFNEVSSDPIKSLAEVKSENSDNKIYSEDVVKGFISEAINKATNTSELLKAQEQLDCLQPIEAVDERGIKQTLYIEKGKKALIGEVRTWKGKEYKKKADGKWEKVVKTWVEDFVDEDTGEVVQITRNQTELDASAEREERSSAEYREQYMDADKSASPTRRRKQRKGNAKIAKVEEARKDLEYELEDLAEQYKYCRDELKQLDSDMNNEAGQKGEEWSDADGNRYGGMMMEVEAKMEKLVPQMKDLKIRISNLERKEEKIFDKTPDGEKYQREWEAENLTKGIDDILEDFDTIVKGHMDFAGRGDSGSGGGKSGLVKKQLTDSKGRQTTRWVKQGEDESGQEEKKQPEEEEESEPKGTKTTEDHAKETSSEDLKAYLDKNPDGEHAEHAKQELSGRGEEGEGTAEIDYSNPESVKEALASHEDRDSIIDYAIEHGITPGQAMKMMDSNKTDHSETHSKIDAAQSALDDLKSHTDHPSSVESTMKQFGSIVDMVDMGEDGDGNELSEELQDDIAIIIERKINEIDADKDWFDFQETGGGGSTADNIAQFFMENDVDMADVVSEAQELIDSKLKEPSGDDEPMAKKDMEREMEREEDEGEDYDSDEEQRNDEEDMPGGYNDDGTPMERKKDKFADTDNMSPDQMMQEDIAMSDIEDALYDMFGGDFKQGVHIDDLDEVLANHDIADWTGESETGTINGMDNAKELMADLLEREDIPVERPMEKQGRSDEPKENKDTANEDKGAPKEFTPDALKTIESMGEHIWNRQGGEMDTPKLFEQYMGLRKEGYSEQDIETEMGKGQWDEGAMMSDEEKEGMKEEWDSALDAILGEDRKKDAPEDDSKKKDETTRKQNWTRSGNPIVDANADNDYYSDATAEDHDDIVEHYNEMHSGGNLPDLDAKVKERVASHSEASERKRKPKDDSSVGSMKRLQGW